MKLIVVQGEEEKTALKEQYAEEAKAVIMSELEHQETLTKEEINGLRKEIEKVKEELEQANSTNKQQK